MAPWLPEYVPEYAPEYPPQEGSGSGAGSLVGVLHEDDEAQARQLACCLLHLHELWLALDVHVVILHSGLTEVGLQASCDSSLRIWDPEVAL